MHRITDAELARLETDVRARATEGNPGLHARVVERLEAERRVRDALDRRERAITELSSLSGIPARDLHLAALAVDVVRLVSMTVEV